MLLEKIDDEFANQHWLAAALVEAGFRKTHDGLLRQRDRGWREHRPRQAVIGVAASPDSDPDPESDQGRA
jgi:ATP-dependent Lhr-like helicase